MLSILDSHRWLCKKKRHQKGLIWLVLPVFFSEGDIFWSFLQFLNFIFNWRINVLPCCIGFCRISTRISHRCIYMSLPSWTSFPPPTLSHPSRLLSSPSSRLRLPCGSVVKNLPADAADMCLIPGSERSPGGGNGDPLQYLSLGNPMDTRAWGAVVHWVAVSQMWLHTHGMVSPPKLPQFILGAIFICSGVISGPQEHSARPRALSRIELHLPLQGSFLPLLFCAPCHLLSAPFVPGLWSTSVAVRLPLLCTNFSTYLCPLK